MAKEYGQSVARMERPKAPAKKSLHHMEMKQAQNGGHVVTHHFESSGMSYHAPEEHVFGDGQDHEMMQHVAKHMGVKMKPESEQEEKDEEKVSPGIHKKVAKMEAAEEDEA